MKYIIRKIQPSDNKILAQIIRSAFTEFDAPKTGTVFEDKTTDNLYELFQQEKTIMLVAEEEGVILGCCGIYPTEGLPNGCAELVKFYLDKNARGKGVGKQLMLQCFDSAKEMGYDALYIESLPHFSKAVNMYEKVGFTHLSAPLGMSGHTSCNIWMYKEL